ncbi:MAG: DUF2510 domain-containing protein [Actinomycetia bacterium]|nr:DUF2510 domain-containing protein [Actinomycetes bacterium]
MAQQPGGWYDDPTNQYMYRYWNGTHWTDQVSSGGATSTDPTAMDSSAATVPPGPGSAAPMPPQTAAPVVQVTQKSGSAIGVIIGVLVALVAVVVLIVVLMNNSGGDSPTTSIEPPATTEAPATTVAP